MSEANKKPVMGVPQQILEQFLDQLPKEDISPALTKRLRTALEGASISETSLRKVLLPDESAA